MTELFLKLLNMGIAAGWLVLAVLAARLLLHRAPRGVLCLLWVLVALRLLCPVAPKSALSLIPSGETVPQAQFRLEPAENQQNAVLEPENNPLYPDDWHTELDVTVDRVQTWHVYATVIWLTGTAVMLLYALASSLRLRFRLRTAVACGPGLYQSESVTTPFVLGVLKPRIFLPFGLSEQEAAYMIAHEQAHIRRGDPWWKLLGFLLLAVYWFKPLLWAAYILLCRDLELACDERAVRSLSREQRADYAQTLLRRSVSRRRPGACPLAFGEVAVKMRIRNLLREKKSSRIAAILAAAVCVVLAVCFLTDPYTQEIRLDGQLYVRQGATVEQLPAGSLPLGELDRVTHRTAAHPDTDFSGTNLDAKYAGNRLYQSGEDPGVIYLEDLSGFFILFRLMGDPAGE